MQQSKESDESVETVRERFSFTWRRNDFLLVFTLLEMRIVKKKRTKQKTNVKKKRFLFLFKREKNVGPTPTVPCVVKMKFPISSSSSIFPKRLEMITLLTTTTTSQGDARVRYMHVKGNKGNRGCPRINKEPTNREKKIK